MPSPITTTSPSSPSSGSRLAGRAWRLLAVAGWLLLFVLLLLREVFVAPVTPDLGATLAKASQESFYGVWFRGQRIGYVHTSTEPIGDTIHLAQEAVLLLNVLEERQPVRLQLTASLDTAQVPRRFRFTLTSPFAAVQVTGTVTGRTVTYTLASGKEEQDGRLELAAPPVLATGDRPYLLAGGPAPGKRMRLAYFDPLTLAGQETVLTYRGREKVLIKGRVLLLHRFVQTTGGIRVNLWLDDQGRVIKEESPAGFVFLREPRFQAMDIAMPAGEMLAAAAAPALGAVTGDLAGRKRLRCRLELPAGMDLSLAGPRQQWQDGVLTVTLEPLPTAGSRACGGPAAALAATPYVQADHPRIRALAAEITAGAGDDGERLARLAHWVFQHIAKRPVVGMPDALATLASRRGDCNEHAALFAALARAAGLPTRIVAGVVFHRNAFYYHAWNQVCLDGGWLSVDTTRDQIPADVGHIRLVDGESAELVQIAGLVGRLRVTILE